MTTHTRRIDDLGRVVLPTATKAFGWTSQTPLDITVQDDETILIRAHKPFCTLCGEAETRLMQVENGAICQSCLQTALKNDVIEDGE